MSNDRRSARLRHTHPLDDINGLIGPSGTIPPALLGTGTADTSVFLRGDGRWERHMVSDATPYFVYQHLGTGVSGYAGVDSEAAFLGSSSAHPTYLYTAGQLRFGVTSDGRLFGRAVHNNAAGLAGTTNDYFGSGTFTPTLTDISAGSSLSVPSAGWYVRVGRVVSGAFFVDGTFATGTVSFQFSLPITSGTTDTTSVNGTVGAASNSITRGLVSGSGTALSRGLVAVNASFSGTFRTGINFSYTVR